jgi:hypothetical protein
MIVVFVSHLLRVRMEPGTWGAILNEWAYARPYRSEAARTRTRTRTRALARRLHMYNQHRHHTAIGAPPISRVNNVAGKNI